MGLDMYLKGRKYYTNFKKGGIGYVLQPRKKEEGFEVTSKQLDLGYWRKHPNLHGYIVDNFADGRDECQDIYLEKEHIQQIIDAVKADELPETEGFFFGKSKDADDQETIKQLKGALNWLNKEIDGIWKSVIYCASW